MQNPMKSRFTLVLGVVLAALAPVASAHGLDGHHAPFMTLLRHLLTEHGYLLVLPIALGMVWLVGRDHNLRDLLRLRRPRD